MNDEHLAHYGVLGMKWGVRKPESIERLKRAGVRAKVKYDPARIVGEVNDKTVRAGRNVLKVKRKLVEEGALKKPTPKNIQRVLNQSSAHEARLKARAEGVRGKAASTSSIARAAKLGKRASMIDEKIARESLKRDKIVKRYDGKSMEIVERSGTVKYFKPKDVTKKAVIGAGASAIAVASGGTTLPAVVTVAALSKLSYDSVANGVKTIPASRYSVYSKVEFKEVEKALDDMGYSINDIDLTERR